MSFKEPNTKAPRFREKHHNVLNINMYKVFIKKNPKYENLTYEMFKDIIRVFNKKLVEGTIDNRDGIALPQSLGYLLVTKCESPDKPNVDYNTSKKLGTTVFFKNWDTDNYLAKICYTNYTLMYAFKERCYWKFTPHRDFKNRVTATFADMYNKYIFLDKKTNLCDMYKNYKTRL